MNSEEIEKLIEKNMQGVGVPYIQFCLIQIDNDLPLCAKLLASAYLNMNIASIKELMVFECSFVINNIGRYN